MHSIRLGRVFGIEVRVDWSILVTFGLLTWDFAVLAMPAIAPGYPATSYWAVAVVSTACFIATIAAHELGHCYIARRRGIRVRDITLWMLGGLATIDGEPTTPRAELEIAIAGPAVSAVIGTLGTFAGIACVQVGLSRILAAAVVWVAMFNLLLAVFNLAPATPLDGGRVLRAWLWHRTGDRARATITAARAGKVFAFALTAIGVAELAIGAEIGGLWLVLLAAFVLRAARAEERDATFRKTDGQAPSFALTSSTPKQGRNR